MVQLRQYSIQAPDDRRISKSKPDEFYMIYRKLYLRVSSHFKFGEIIPALKHWNSLFFGFDGNHNLDIEFLLLQLLEDRCHLILCDRRELSTTES